MQAARNQLFSAAGLSFDQHRERRVRVLGNLALEMMDRGARPDQGLEFRRRARKLRGPERKRLVEHALQRDRIARLGYEFRRSKRARVPRIRRIVLSREDEYFHARGVRQQISDERKALIGCMGARREPEVDQSELRRVWKLAHELDGMPARFACMNVKVGTQRKRKRVRYELVVVDDQQDRFLVRRRLRGGCH
jgi:hypothetical protein